MMPRSCLIIADVAQAHDGSLGTAHAFVDAVARTGADAIKFQMHIAEAESTPGEPWRVRFSPQDETRYEYWQRMEFTPEQWQGLRDHTIDKGLKFLCSPFSLEAVEILANIGVDYWKIASGEVDNKPMLAAMAQTGDPFILSTGMSDFQEIDASVAVIKGLNRPLTLLQCTTEYPCPPDKLGLNVIPLMRQRYGCPVGLSDHSGKIWAGLAAVAQGAEMLEVHIALSREMFGPDVTASLVPDELAQLAEGVDFIEAALANPVDKDEMAAAKADLRRMFGKSIVAAGDLAAGQTLGEKDLALKKPGSGLPPGKLETVIGRKLLRDLDKDQQLSEDHLGPE
jgi:N,N'-diacetyllegionaminate synthase